MRVLVACEFSATVRDAFNALGHVAMSCDLLETENPDGLHYQGNVLDVLDGWIPACLLAQGVAHFSLGNCETTTRSGQLFARPIASPHWDLMVAHPPCTYLCSSGWHWTKKIPGRLQQAEEALQFVAQLLAAPIAKIALENPVGVISSRIRKPDQIIQPWMFGEDASKATCLWLKGLVPLVPTNIIKKDRYANQLESGQNNLPPSKDRWKIRSKTYRGIAEAMAQQWGGLVAPVVPVASKPEPNQTKQLELF
jgi:hypothetical protein